MSDGGSPVELYIVEKRDNVTHEWVQCAEVKGTKASIEGLKEGNEYQFRVKAVNKAGPGQPSDASDKKVAKARWGNFFIRS